MKIEITAKGIYGAPTKENKTGEIAVGTVIDVKEEPKAWDGRYRVVSGGSTDGKEPVTNPADEKGWSVKKKGGGYSVVTFDGEEVTKSLRKDDLEGFEDLSNEDKAAFAELHKKEA